MAHKIVQGRVVVDWVTGDPEGDRLVVLKAYHDFIALVQEALKGFADREAFEDLRDLFDEWEVSTKHQIDGVPRIWIKRPQK